MATGHGLDYHEFTPIDHRLGLNASAVNCVVQDGQGLIWLGTDRGLFSFDGYQARHYPPPARSVSDNTGVIYCALMTDSVQMWLGTDDGLLVFNTFTDSYVPAPEGLPDNIRSLARINDNSFWIGSLNGLYRYDSEKVSLDMTPADELPHQAIYTIMRYDETVFYFGTYNGLSRVDLSNDRFRTITLRQDVSVTNQLILSLLPDYDRNCIWVGVEGGLFRYNPSTGHYSEIKLLKGNSVKSLLLDNRNCLWAGTDNGLFIYDPDTDNHRLLRHDATNDRSLLNNVVWSIFSDREQNIWVGTDAGTSLFMHNKKISRKSISELTGSNEGNQIISLLVDNRGILWLGGTNGIIRADRVSGEVFWYQQNNPQLPLPHNKVRDIFEDSDGDIWIATDGSICRYDEVKRQFVRYQVEDASHQRNANWSYDICQDETRKLWIATCLGGLFVADKQKLLASGGRPYVAERNYYSNNGPQSLSGNMLQFLALDADRNMWVGTYRDGISKIDRMNQRVSRFTTGTTGTTIPSDDVTAMITDRENQIWLALRDCIVLVDPKKITMKTITDPRLDEAYINGLADDGKRIWMSASSGLFFIEKSTGNLRQINPGSNYFSSVCYDNENHRIIAGGINEFVQFDPETIVDDDRRCSLFITSLLVNDKQLPASAGKGNDSRPVKELHSRSGSFLSRRFTGTKNQLQNKESNRNKDEETGQPIDGYHGSVSGCSIRFLDGAHLSHDQNNLTFTFSELNYSQQNNMQYASKMDGFDFDWHLTEKGDNRLTYNNLPPGEYSLMLARIGSDGNPIPDSRTFEIRISHPWYATTFARAVYFVLLTLLVIAIINYFIVLNRLRFERIDKAKTKELTAHKVEFLTNISHELKTPLSLIIGPLGNIIEKTRPVSLKDQLVEVRHNALKMSSLIHRMLEAGRQEFDSFGLILSKADLVAFVHSSISPFEKQLNERSVSLVVQSEQPSVYIDADLFKLEVIINNILSNASKFAPDGSEINVNINDQGDKVRISVSDQGPGIDASDLPHVFERYYQAPGHTSNNREGSGIGLSVVKSYVQQHNGSVRALSDGVSGTTVIVELPKIIREGDMTPASDIKSASLAWHTENKPVVLVVEDNIEILNFISGNLSPDFLCLSAQNGRLGLEKAVERHPDIIIADLMMPVMDGIEMCRKLKENITTSMIPVIILTARDDRNSELLAYRTGADAFIAKPFEIGYLADRIHNLLKGRSMLVQKARQEAIIRPRESEGINTSEKFLTTITQIIDNDLTNPALNVKHLSEKSGYSLKQIYRRIKALTGQTAVDYIRSVRLKKAAVLLSNNTFTVTEVMYMVGFNNLSYFSKRFRQMYGNTPMKYASESKLKQGYSTKERK
jgi:ligand-binding sensor domain-containing protein/signal transduction histidine kinase/CheY-like chemotaxis protein